MEENLNSEIECIICEDQCSSLRDLKQHLSTAHKITKARLPIYVKESVEEKVLKKRKYREEKYPEEENNSKERGTISEKEKNAEQSRSAVNDSEHHDSEELTSVAGENVATATTDDPEEEKSTQTSQKTNCGKGKEDN